MKYELCKELKENGYPQGDEYIPGRCIWDEEQKGLDESDIAYLPTLSELIDACGDEFLNLYKTGSVWNCVHPYEDNDDILGKTPEEAVAKLWLALNKK